MCEYFVWDFDTVSQALLFRITFAKLPFNISDVDLCKMIINRTWTFYFRTNCILSGNIVVEYT